MVGFFFLPTIAPITFKKEVKIYYTFKIKLLFLGVINWKRSLLKKRKNI